MPDWTVRRRGTDSSGRGVYASDYMWDWWLGVCDELGFTPTITQGAWMTMAGGGADDSAGYHDGGGCFDLRVWDRSEEQVTRMIHVLRSNGAAAWLRNPQHGGFTDPHVHFVLGTDHDLDSGAVWQWREYIAGRDGLASEGPDYHWRPSPLVLVPPKEDDMQEADFERLQQMMDKAADRIAKAVVQGLLAADLFPKREDIDRTVREALRTASAPPKDKGKS